MRHRATVFLVALLAVSTASAATIKRPGPLVDTEWLAHHLDAPGLVLLDVRADTASFTQKSGSASSSAAPGIATCGPKKSGKNPEIAGHIPKARLWDWKTVRAKRTMDGMELDGMVPTKDAFETLMRDLGVNNDSLIVITADGSDTPTLTFATRAYWTLKYYGHDNVAVLDGGTAKWKNEGRPLTHEPTQASPKGNFAARAERRELFASGAEVEQAMKNKNAQVIDARTADFYLGQSKKDYVYAKGHIPGAKNVSHTDLADPKSRAFKSRDELKKMLADAGLDPQKPAITYCDSGHLSTGQWFVMHELLGNKNVKLFDGSMHEWTKKPERPVSTQRE